MAITLDTTLKILVSEIFSFSEDLGVKDPEVVTSGTQIHLSWAGTGVAGEAENSVIDIYLVARPVAPARILINKNPDPLDFVANPSEHTSIFAPAPQSGKSQKRSKSLRTIREPVKT